MVFILFSMSRCSNPQLLMKFLIVLSHLHRLSKFKVNSNMKFQKSSIPRLIDVVHVNSYKLYLVHWLGYENTDEEYSWLPSTELEHASELISDFHSAYPDKPGPTSRL